ncbi:peptidase domain-containing ABC transporter [Actinomycetota bacterium Odt1-20B]
MPLRTKRVRYQPQTSATECGAACLAMILSYFGCRTAVRDLRERLGIGRDGATALALARAAREYGLAVSAVRCEPWQLPRLALPAIVHWGFQHFVILEEISQTSATIMDPAGGRRTVGMDEFSREFTGVVLTFEPTPTLARSGREQQGIVRFLGRYLPRRLGMFGAIAAFSLLLTLIGLLPAGLTSYVVDTLIPSGSASALPVVSLSVGLLVLSMLVVTYGRSVMLLYLQTVIDIRLMSNFLGHLLRLPFSYFQLRTSGDLLLRLSSNAIIRDLVTSQAIALLLDLASSVLYLGLLFSIAPDYAGVILAFAVVQLGTVVVTTRRAADLSQRELGAMSEAQSYMVESIVGVESLKASGAEGHVYERWERLFGSQVDAARRRKALDNVVDAVVQTLRTAMTLGLSLYGAWCVLDGRMSLGTMLALNAIGGSLIVPMNNLANTARQMQTVGVHVARLKDVLDEEPEQDDATPRRQFTLRGAVELDRVSYAYGKGGPPAVRDVSVSCPPGSLIAVVGATGSGKSTLSRLLLGLYQPSSGRVLYDGVDLAEADVAAVRRQCGVVVQDVAVFSGSILDNITLAAPDAPLDEVVEAARIACLHDDVMRMPMKYETYLAEGGMGLSGGQKQRLALARAVVARPALLLLDEATSHLDARTEAEVHLKLSELRCTRVVIAHRLSTVRSADLILVMDQGEVVERGTHEELLRLRGAYAKLVAAQTGGERGVAQGGFGPAPAMDTLQISVPNPQSVILAAARAGHHLEAAALAAAHQQEAYRHAGPGSPEVTHWVEVRADLARLAGDAERACRLWMSAADARLERLAHPEKHPAKHRETSDQSGGTEKVEEAVDRAHREWRRVTDPKVAHALAADLLDLRARVPGGRPAAPPRPRVEALANPRAERPCSTP